MTEGDIVEALSVPAHFINTTVTLHRDNIIRIAFGESARSRSRFHVAVAMSKDNARGLIESLQQYVGDEADAE
jgi:hypothetical protein